MLNPINPQTFFTIFFCFYPPTVCLTVMGKGEDYKYTMLHDVTCPECHSNKFKHDLIHDEIYCATCGLVLVAPPCYGLVFPGFRKH